MWDFPPSTYAPVTHVPGTSKVSGTFDLHIKHHPPAFREIRIGPTFRCIGKTVSQGMGVNGASDLLQIRIAARRQRVVAIFKECAAALVNTIEGARIADKHTLRQQPGRLWTILADEPMVVVGQQAGDDDADVAVPADALEQAEQAQSVVVVSADGPASHGLAVKLRRAQNLVQ